MSPLVYALTFLFPALAAVAFTLGGAWTLAVPVLTFVVIPLAELVLPGTTLNLDADQERGARSRPMYDVLVYAMVPVQVGLLVYFLAKVPALSEAEQVAATLSMGICCGAFGINVAHELGHRRTRHERLMAKMLLLTSLYMHFFIEHNRGHHARVATDDDPASARQGETVYAFWWRSVTRGWLSAWRLERKRLRGRWLSARNEMLWFQGIQVALVACVFAVGGPAAGLAFLAAASIGILLLETVNYVEHYGLRRSRVGDRYERVRPVHSWNSNHPLGRTLLFELTRHSDHHAHPGRPYPVLRHFDDSPQLPTGYPGMILLALVPPLWFAVMDGQVARERARVAA